MMLFVFTSLLLFSFSSGDTSPDRRIDCAPGRTKTKEHCLSNGCTWDDGGEPNTIPLCYFPDNTGYIASQTFQSGDKSIKLQKSSASVKNPFGDDFQNLVFEWKELGAGVYVKISPDNTQR